LLYTFEKASAKLKNFENMS